MSRRNRGKPAAEAVAPTTAAKAELDSAKDGSTGNPKPFVGGGSVMGTVITEAAFLRPPLPTFMDSPFGQRYLCAKPKSCINGDVQARGQIWAFSLRGYCTYGTVVAAELAEGENLLKDWYPLVRDMAKRSLKYKHLPTTLSDYNMLKYWCDAYFYVLANLTTLLNLNRLLQYNAAFSYLCAILPTYMSRITRLWRRLSALSAPPFLKAHAIRNGQVVFAPGVLAPTIRMWSPEFLLPSGSGGPSPYILDKEIDEILPVAAELGPFVYGLELTEKWLETGATAISSDFIAVRDLVDMSADIVPGTFVPGLPDPKDVPGLSIDLSVITDLLRRAVFRKDVITAGTDRWIIFPVPEMSDLGGRIPVCGLGQPTMNDFTYLGAPKYGVFYGAAAGTKSVDVDSNLMVPGTDFQMISTMDISATDARSIFGSKTGTPDEEMWTAPLGTAADIFSAYDLNVASTIRAAIRGDALRMLHPWDDVRYHDRDAWAAGWTRLVEEVGYSYLMYMEPSDLAYNYAEFLDRKSVV